MVAVGVVQEAHCSRVVVAERQNFSEAVVVPCELELKDYLELAAAEAPVHDSGVEEALRVYDCQQTEAARQT